MAGNLVLAVLGVNAPAPVTDAYVKRIYARAFGCVSSIGGLFNARCCLPDCLCVVSAGAGVAVPGSDRVHGVLGGH
jgi:hypothetical protein